MLLSAVQLGSGRGRVIACSLVAAAIAIVTLSVCGLFEVTQWFCWIGGGVLSAAAGIVGALGAGTTRFRQVDVTD